MVEPCARMRQYNRSAVRLVIVRSVHKDILNSREYGATEFCMLHDVWLCVHSMAQAHILAESMKELQRVLLDKTSQCGRSSPSTVKITHCRPGLGRTGFHCTVNSTPSPCGCRQPPGSPCGPRALSHRVLPSNASARQHFAVRRVRRVPRTVACVQRYVACGVQAQHASSSASQSTVA